jgi:hypothetical protein
MFTAQDALDRDVAGRRFQHSSRNVSQASLTADNALGWLSVYSEKRQAQSMGE